MNQPLFSGFQEADSLRATDVTAIDFQLKWRDGDHRVFDGVNPPKVPVQPRWEVDGLWVLQVLVDIAYARCCCRPSSWVRALTGTQFHCPEVISASDFSSAI